MSLTFNFRLQQTVYAWANGQPLKLLRPSPALLEVLQSLALDFSIASLERIEAWLQNEHAQRVAKQLPSRDAKSDAKLLLFLSAYIAEVLGRAIRAVPMWQKINNVPMVSWLGAEHAQRPMLALTLAIHNCLVGETADLLPPLLQALGIERLPHSERDRPLPLVELPADTHFKACIELSPEQASELFTAEPAGMSGDDLLNNFFHQAPQLFAQAQCVRAALVQANTSLYVPRYVGGSTAEAVFDLTGRLSFEDLISISNHLFELKKKDFSLLPTPARLIAEHLKDSGTGARMLDWDAPAKLLGWPLRMSSIWIEQKHLPDGMLSYDGLQLLIAPKEVSLYAMLLPRWYWSAEYLKRWQDASMARHGQLHDIESLVRAAKERAGMQATAVVNAATALPGSSATRDDFAATSATPTASSTEVAQHSHAIEPLNTGEPEEKVTLANRSVTANPATSADLATGEVKPADAPDTHDQRAPVEAVVVETEIARPALAASSPAAVPSETPQASPPTPAPAAKPHVPPGLQTLNTPTRAPSWLSRYWLWLLALGALAALAFALR